MPLVINGTSTSAPSPATADGTAIPRVKRTRRRWLLTLADVVDHLLTVDEIRSTDARSVDRCIKAAQTAISSFASYSMAGFKYYHARAKLVVEAPVSLGAVTVSGGRVTVTSGYTPPSWMSLASLRINNSFYLVSSYDGTGFYVDTALADGSYTSASLEQLIVRLPDDFRRRGSISDGQNFYPVTDVHAGVLQSWQDFYQWARSGTTSQQFGAITGDQRFQGENLLAVWPSCSSRRELQLFYERYPGPLLVHRYGVGTMETVTSSPPEVTASTASFSPNHLGAALMIAVDGATDVTKSLTSRDTVSEQRVITSIVSATNIRIDESFDDGGAPRTFYVSDVVDVMPGVMTEAFLRLAEYELARQAKSTKSMGLRKSQFMEQLDLAMADDARYHASIDDGPYGHDCGFGIGTVNGTP